MTDYQLLPPLSAEEYDALKAAIAGHGYDPAHPIVVDEAGNILDGHHRQAICRELGITPPTVTRAGLTEEQKAEYALSANLRRRHLGQDERRMLVRRLRDRHGWSVRAIERATGIPKSTVARYLAPVPDGTPEEEDPRSALERFGSFYGGRATTLMAALEQLEAEYGVTLDEATLRDVAEQVHLQAAIREAARHLVREDVTDMPPDWWEPLQYKRHANSPLAERQRLAEWEIRVMREAGQFITWCERAGIKFNYDQKRVELPERGLRYPPHDERKAKVLAGMGLSAEDEHAAALGAFWCWWCTEDELRGMSAEAHAAAVG